MATFLEHVLDLYMYKDKLNESNKICSFLTGLHNFIQIIIKNKEKIYKYKFSAVILSTCTHVIIPNCLCELDHLHTAATTGCMSEPRHLSWAVKETHTHQLTCARDGSKRVTEPNTTQVSHLHRATHTINNKSREMNSYPQINLNKNGRLIC